jgi:hypothetical protein
VLSVEPAPAPRPGRGRLVTGTFAHAATNVVDVTIAGLTTPIGCTANHPFWSHDRQTFVAAGELKAGEQLRTADGGLTSVVSVAPRSGAERVYNLEVDGEHVYYVSADGVLVHNSCSKLRTELKKTHDFKPGEEAHHLVPQGPFTGRNADAQRHVRESQDILKRAGIDIHEAANGMRLPRAVHAGLHTNSYLAAVYSRLSSVDGQGHDAVARILESIRQDISAGQFPF